MPYLKSRASMKIYSKSQWLLTVFDEKTPPLQKRNGFFDYFPDFVDFKLDVSVEFALDLNLLAHFKQMNTILIIN